MGGFEQFTFQLAIILMDPVSQFMDKCSYATDIYLPKMASKFWPSMFLFYGMSGI